MNQIPLFGPARGDGPLIVAYGGGVNTIALLVRLRDLGQRPDAIVMADPGSERKGTHPYRVTVADPWLRAQGWPAVTVVTLAEEAKYRPRAKDTAQRTLREECAQLHALPSIAYGWKKCSQKYKARPAVWWTERQSWAVAAWARGEKITRAIGYDAGEDRRALDTFGDPKESARFAPWYPLHAAGIDRDGCVDLIRSAGLPVPSKSACTFCPSNTLQEWDDLRRDDPEAFADAMEMSREAFDGLDVPDVVGLMRCNPAGRRQLHLHVWQDDAPTGETADDARDAIPCECAL